MTCPVCGERSKVVDNVDCVDEYYRKRKCTSCGYTFYTVEYETDYNEEVKEMWNKYHRSSKNNNI